MRIGIVKRIAVVVTALVASLGVMAADKEMCCSSCGKTMEGKTVVMLGDSYVRNHRRPFEESWHAKVASRLGMKYVNFGRNGSSIAFDRRKDGFGPAMTERYKEMPDTADYVVVIAGHNDADYLRTHGIEQWDEFCKGLDTLLSGLREKYPEAKIGFVTPWAVDRQYFKEVTDQIRKACAAHGVPVLDMASMGVIDVNNPEFRARYFQGPNDTAHLNAEGHDLLLTVGEEFFRSL
ncbi:MAG: SGNH/GDSL hydrolase family protein [Muribaculaceae bacterium]|nr:SGNH/GDSL hydrolase family protein [Muribaculaceae bacterium]MDE6771388.1 SGNH/GDSL hydrolase family protein [Muribaculaceae bacterium]